MSTDLIFSSSKPQQLDLYEFNQLFLSIHCKYKHHESTVKTRAMAVAAALIAGLHSLCGVAVYVDGKCL